MQNSPNAWNGKAVALILGREVTFCLFFLVIVELEN